MVKEEDGWQVADPKLGREFRAILHIHLANFDLSGPLLGYLLKDGGQHSAGAAPTCPKVHNDRDFGVQNLSLEDGGNEFNYFALLCFIHQPKGYHRGAFGASIWPWSLVRAAMPLSRSWASCLSPPVQ